MNVDEAGCKRVTFTVKEFETTKPRLIKGDLDRLKKVCKKLDEAAKKRDGFLKQGVNRCTTADAIHVALDCLEIHGLQPADSQSSLANFVAGE